MLCTNASPEPRTRRKRYYGILGVLLVSVIFAGVASIVTTQKAPLAHAAASTSNDILFVHGFSAGEATDCNATWNEVTTYLKTDYSWVGTMHDVGWYNKDSNCDPSDDLNNLTPQCSGFYDANQGTNNEALEHLGCELAWLIYDQYTSQGKPVDVVAHSMGGLIIRYALFGTATRQLDAANGQTTSPFPPSLNVPAVVTIATPHLGFDGTADYIASLLQCGGCSQPGEMASGSPFMKTINTSAGYAPQGSGGTKWMTMAMAESQKYHGPTSPGCTSNIIGTDSVPGFGIVTDPLGQIMPFALDVIYKTPCYTHGGYLTNANDNSDAFNATAAVGYNLNQNGTLNYETYSRPLRALRLFLTPGACVGFPGAASCDAQDFQFGHCNSYPQSQTYHDSVVSETLMYSTNCQSNWTSATIIASGYVIREEDVERQATSQTPAAKQIDYPAATSWYNNMLWAPVAAARGCVWYGPANSPSTVYGPYCTAWSSTPVLCANSPSDAHCNNQDYIQQGCNHYVQGGAYSNTIITVDLEWSTNCQSNFTWATMNDTTNYGLYKVDIERQSGTDSPPSLVEYPTANTWYTNMLWAPNYHARGCAWYYQVGTPKIFGPYCTAWV